MATAKHTEQTSSKNDLFDEIQPRELNEKLNSDFLGVEKIPLSNEQIFAKFKQVKNSELEELTSEYFNFKSPGEYHFIAKGIVMANLSNGKNPGEEKTEREAVLLESETGESLINANAVLVNSVKKIKSLPCYIRVEYVGEVKGAGGTYKKLEVRSFPEKEILE